MSDRLLNRIELALKKIGRTVEGLDGYLRDNGVEYSVLYIDVFADPPVIRLIASYLDLEPSVLFENTNNSEAFARAVFDEYWPMVEAKVSVSSEEAWRHIADSVEYKGQRFMTVRQQIKLALDGLVGPTDYSLQCNFLDCPNRCLTRCLVTGRHPGA